MAEIRSHHLSVTRTARYCTLGEPGPAVRELWLACHGYGQTAAGFAVGLSALAHPSRFLVAPEALSRFYVRQEEGRHGPDSPVGATWMTREDRLAEIDDYAAYLDRLHELAVRDLRAPLHTVALGFSQGAATISRWMDRTSARIDDVVLWGARLPPELRPDSLGERWNATRVTLVAGTRDRWCTERELTDDAARLNARGIPARVLTFDGGHRLDDATLLRICHDLAA